MQVRTLPELLGQGERDARADDADDAHGVAAADALSGDDADGVHGVARRRRRRPRRRRR